MKIIHFLGIGRVPKRPLVDPAAGTERVALELARIQARRGHDVTVVSFAPEAWEGTWEGVRLRHLQSSLWARLGTHAEVQTVLDHIRLTRFIRCERFDFVHLHEYRNTFFFGRLPAVIHFHNNPLDGKEGEAFDRAARSYWRKLGRVGAQIGVSAFVGRRLQLSHDRAGPTAPVANIVVNQSGVVADSMTPEERRAARIEVRRELGLKDDDVLFLFAGAVRPEKGVIQLAEAFSKLSAQHNNAFLAIAGGSKLWVDDSRVDDTEAKVRRTLADAISRGRAKMLGMVSPLNMPAYYAAADVFVLPSMFQETFGLVILEAFAAGVPVIGARSGGIPELVVDGRTGMLVDQGDVNGLVDTMEQLLDNRGLRERLGAAARQLAENMSWEDTVDRLEPIYQAVTSSSLMVSSVVLTAVLAQMLSHIVRPGPGLRAR